MDKVWQDGECTQYILNSIKTLQFYQEIIRDGGKSININIPNTLKFH